MSKYIDVDVLRHNIMYHANAAYLKGNNDQEDAYIRCLYLIDCMPIFDVVRCKDCKYYLHSNEKCELIDTRLHFYETDNTWTEECDGRVCVGDCDLCSHAEESEDDDEQIH